MYVASMLLKIIYIDENKIRNILKINFVWKVQSAVTRSKDSHSIFVFVFYTYVIINSINLSY